MPFGSAKYGAAILSFANNDPAIFLVDTTQFFQVGDLVRVANLVTSTGDKKINNDYSVLALGSDTIALGFDSTLSGSYVSGGFITILESVNTQNTPFLQSNLNTPLLPWRVFNQALGSQVQTVEFISEVPFTGSNL